MFYLHEIHSFEKFLIVTSGKAATADPVSIKSHFEELYDQKKEKQPDLDTIKEMIGELLANPEACDKNNIRDVQSDVCSKWHDFTELLIDLIVMQVCTGGSNPCIPTIHFTM